MPRVVASQYHQARRYKEVIQSRLDLFWVDILPVGGEDHRFNASFDKETATFNTPESPVLSHPSSVNVAAVASGFLISFHHVLATHLISPGMVADQASHALP